MVIKKTCFKCHELKPLSNFYAHPKSKDGHLNKCKECTKLDVLTYRANNLEKVRAYDKQRSKNKERIKAAYEITKAWRQADKRRMAAHNAVSRAIKSGKLIRLPCQKCGNPKSVAHHEDYDNLLNVVWLCQSCHVKHHKGNKLYENQ